MFDGLLAERDGRLALALGAILCLFDAATPPPLVGTEPLSGTPSIQDLDYSRIHDVGDIRLLITNWGQVGSQPRSDEPWSSAPSAEWPAGSGTEYLRDAGVWIGARVGPNLDPHVTTAVSPSEFRPPAGETARVYASSEGEPGGERYPSAMADDDADGSEDEDWLDGVDNDGDGAIDEDFAAISNQMFFSEYSDVDPSIVTETPEHAPLQFQVQQSSFAWSQPDLANFIGFDYRLISQSPSTLSDVYVGFFADCDIGPRGRPDVAADDQAGFWDGIRSVQIDGVSRNVRVTVVYMYDEDEDSGASPGWIGIVFLGDQLPHHGDTPNRVRLANARFIDGQVPYELGGDPASDVQRYQILDGTSPRSLPPPDPSTGLYPARGTTSASDYRLVVSTGPLSASGGGVEQGDTLSVQFGLVLGAGFEEMMDNAARAQVHYEGAWFDRDSDPTTGVQGREAAICPSEDIPWGTPFPIAGTWPFGSLPDPAIIDWCEGYQFCVNQPPSNTDCWVQVRESCAYINADCWLEEQTGLVTGIEGREHQVHWIDDPARPDTLLPVLTLLPPVRAGEVFIAPPDLVMRWEHAIPAAPYFVEPDSSRWVVIPSEVDLDWNFASFPDSLITLPEGAQWSPWVAWDAPDSSGIRAEVRDLLRMGEPGAPGGYIFAVQAMNVRGELTPGFDWEAWGRNNVALIRVWGDAGPILTVEETGLGMAVFSGDPPAGSIDAVSNRPLRFRWSADAFDYGGLITAYRYGWDVLNPEDDASWDTDWDPGVRSAERTFTSGVHSLHIQARDDLDLVVSAVLNIHLHAAARDRMVLLVDDSDHQMDVRAEQRADSLWQRTLVAIAEEAGFDFSPSLDVYDVIEHQHEPPELDRLLRYAAVVWDSRPGAGGLSALRLGRFVDPVPDRAHNSTANFNALKTYLESGGKLWVSGFRPARSLWPSFALGQPVNVTNWNDPIQPHPDVDSVGTTSLLYKLGVELFDLGAGLETPRRMHEHFCQGLNVAKLGAPTLDVDPELWPQPPSTGRSNVEIYNMAFGMIGGWPPPPTPPPWRSDALYTYVSGVPEDPFVRYPQTADKQAVCVVSHPEINVPVAGAITGFDLHLLSAESHLQIGRYVLLNEMGLGPTPVLLQSFDAAFDGKAVHVVWRMNDAVADEAEFLLQGTSGERQWTVPYTREGPLEFTGRDESPHVNGNPEITYSLFYREADSGWRLLGRQTLQRTAPPAVTQLLAPRPNPFNPRTVIPFELAAPQHIKLEIYRLDGKRVATLVHGVREAGPGRVVWDGLDEQGRPVASGVYVARLQAGPTRLSRKLVLLR